MDSSSRLFLRDRDPRRMVLEEYTARYTVTKNSWKGRYMRIFCIGPQKIATINPQSIFHITNSWEYKTQLIGITANPHVPTEFSITIGKSGRNETMNFRCSTAADRANLLTDVQRCRAQFDILYQDQVSTRIFPARKYSFTEEYRQCQLRVTNIALEQINREGGVVGEYLFVNIKGLTCIRDNPHSLVVFYGPQLKMHLYEMEDPSRVTQLIAQCSRQYVGLPPFHAVQQLTQQQFDSDRLGVDRSELATLAEFPVMKHTPKHGDTAVRRILATTRHCVIEIDPSTYTTVSAYFLSDLYALIRAEDDDQRFMIQFKDPAITKLYTSPMRDALLAHLVDGCRAAGNLNVCVIATLFDRGKRAGSCSTTVSEEIESTLLNCLMDPQKGGGPIAMTFTEVAEFFNANIEYSGLSFTENRDGIFAENREKMIFGALTALLKNFPRSTDPLVVVQQFYALRRLCVTRIGFSSSAIVPYLMRGIECVCLNALKLNSVAVSHAVIDFLNVLMTPHHNNYEWAHEEANKNRILGDEKFVHYLLVMLHDYTSADSATLVVQALLDFFVYTLCPPYSETTDAMLFTTVMKDMVSTTGRGLFVLLQHRCRAISYSAGQLIRVVMEEGSDDQFFTMQRASLAEGSVLGQLHHAIFSTNRDERDLARQLISYWTYDNIKMQDLMRRIFPLAMLHYLQSKEDPPDDEMEKEHTKDVTIMTDAFRESKRKWFKKRFNPSSVLPARNLESQQERIFQRQRFVKVKSTLNWPMLFHQVKQDHQRPDLIWNHTTRNELREALESEMQALHVGMELRRESAVCWNYQEFEARYPSLNDELRIGQHYPRLLFEVKDPVIAQPKNFFNDMYHRFLLSLDYKTRLSCLHGMSILYEHYAEDIGQFNDVDYIIKMLATTMDPVFRDRLLVFILQLLRARHNVKPFLDSDGLKPLVELLTIAHLHVDRPQLYSVASNAIESGAQSSVDLQNREKEWHYTVNGEKQGPVSYTELRQLYADGTVDSSTKVWAQGLGAWAELKDVPQLRWGIVTESSPKLLTLTEVSSIILDIFSLLCAYYPSQDEDRCVMQPLPKVRRFLSSPAVLPHIVQLLLTFDPSLCASIHKLLYLLVEDNPLVSRFFLTGAFFFSLMYTGSDVLPLCRLLHLTHLRQAFQFQHDNEIIRQSVLSPMLPPALICFLANHGPERFADVFLGEYETPEAIWGREMRRYLVEKISVHISDFTPRLLGNNRAVYQYCPIVGVVYSQLENELFCSQYYLRHLCDELRYPNWAIADPVALLRNVLTAWRRELDKKPSGLSISSCMEELEITDDVTAATLTPQAVRKAYFRLAAQYHPDKNPNGRERFERIQTAYEFLVSGNAVSSEPLPTNIALLLRTQSILFRRFGEEMRQYKYAGYDLLLKLVRMEYADPEMLHKEVVLMEPATELCYSTVENVPLNADELQEEGGIELLASVSCRCAELLTPNATDEMVHVKILRHCMHTFRVAAEIADCRQRILEEPSICHLAACGIAYEKAVVFSRACIRACQALCVDETLQKRVVHAGAIWHLLLFLFRYDYTIDATGVELSEEHHTQLFANRAAINALQAIYALAGIQPGEGYPKTAFNGEIFRLLQKLLTPYIAHKMLKLPNEEKTILKLLNGNHETPYILWNNESRRELDEYLNVNSEKCRDAPINSTDLPPLNDNNFIYTIHTKELIVGGVFVRIYNKQPTFPIEEPAVYCAEMMKFLQCRLADKTPNEVAMVLESMRYLITSYITADVMSVLEHCATVLIKVLSYDDNEIIVHGMKLLEQATMQRGFMEALGEVNIAVSETILAIDRGGDTVIPSALAFLRVALTDRGMVQQALDRGLYAILIRIVATTTMQECKDDACVCIAKACADKLCGPKVLLRASKLLPIVMLEAMKENTAHACQLLDTWQDTPELVWTRDRKARLVEACAACQSDIVETLRSDPTAYWKIPEFVTAERGDEELQIGGVYLSRYINQPGWTVRSPREFLAALLERFLEECGEATEKRRVEIIELVTDSTIKLMQTTPTVADYVVSLGYTQKLFKLLDAANEGVATYALRIIHEECASRACVESFTGFDPVASLMAFLRARPQELTLLMNTLERLLSRSSGRANMIHLALRNHLPQHLLELLEAGLTSEICGDQKPAAVRALIIKVLKSMLAVHDPVYGAQLEGILAESRVWVKYKDQSHDMFLTNSRFGGFIDGPRQQMLSLAAMPTQNDNDADEPPPMGAN